MISEEDKQRYIEAVNCDDCLGWLHHCNAECCKIIFLNVDPKKVVESVRIVSLMPKNFIGLDDRRYFRLRDVDCVRGLLRFKKERISVIGRNVVYIHPCNRLNGNLCLDHPDKKPELCKSVTLEAAKLPGQPFRLTDNCLFAYKCKEVIEDGRQGEN